MNNNYQLNDLLNHLLFSGSKISFVFKEFNQSINDLFIDKNQREISRRQGLYLEFKYEENSVKQIFYYSNLLDLFTNEIEAILGIPFNKNEELKEQISNFERIVKKSSFSFELSDIENIIIFDKDETNFEHVLNEMANFEPIKHENQNFEKLNLETLKNNSTNFCLTKDNKTIRLFFVGDINVEFNNLKFNVKNFNNFYEQYVIPNI